MAEIKIFCLHCGQHIECDESYRGSQINCPTCKELFLIPKAQQSVPPSPPPSPLSSVHDGAILRGKTALLATSIIVGLIGMILFGFGLLQLLSWKDKFSGLWCICFSIIIISIAWGLRPAAQHNKPTGKRMVLIALVFLCWPVAIWYRVTRSFPTPPKSKSSRLHSVVLASLLVAILVVIVIAMLHKV